LSGLDWRERFGEKVSGILVGRNVFDLKSFILFYVVLEPVISDIDVAGAVLIIDRIQK
jgi:hypothetical protein